MLTPAMHPTETNVDSYATEIECWLFNTYLQWLCILMFDHMMITVCGWQAPVVDNEIHE